MLSLRDVLFDFNIYVLHRGSLDPNSVTPALGHKEVIWWLRIRRETAPAGPGCENQTWKWDVAGSLNVRFGDVHEGDRMWEGGVEWAL